MVITDYAGAHSPFMGYSVNEDYSQYWTIFGNPATETIRITENGVEKDVTRSSISFIDNNVFKTNPFFKFSTNSSYDFSLLLMQYDSSQGVFYNKNVTRILRTFLNQKISTTANSCKLNSYYNGNAEVQKHVTVKEFLLAEALPATTLPMGANALTNVSFKDENNFDLNAMKANESKWPKDSKKRPPYNGSETWLHSDYKNLSYQHVQELYKKIKILINGESVK